MLDKTAKSKALIVLQKVVDPSLPDEADVLVQADCVERSLKELGYAVEKYLMTFDLPDFAAKLAAHAPAFIFNLVETLDGICLYSFLAPLMVERYNIPCAGCSAEAMYVTTNKILTKKLLKLAGIATPEWVYGTEVDFVAGQKYILKAVSEEASVGIDQSSVQSFHAVEELIAELKRRKTLYKTDFFAERFIDGREFNISLLASAGGCEVLPPAEITFALDTDKYVNIVDYQAKWDETSVQYNGMDRVFPASCADARLIAEIKAISQKCWEIFQLGGYARVDFRVDGALRPYVLEVNANPCIAPDSGFIAAAHTKGLTYTDVIQRIIQHIGPGNH